MRNLLSCISSSSHIIKASPVSSSSLSSWSFIGVYQLWEHLGVSPPLSDLQTQPLWLVMPCDNMMNLCSSPPSGLWGARVLFPGSVWGYWHSAPRLRWVRDHPLRQSYKLLLDSFCTTWLFKLEISSISDSSPQRWHAAALLWAREQRNGTLTSWIGVVVVHHKSSLWHHHWNCHWGCQTSRMSRG